MKSSSSSLINTGITWGLHSCQGRANGIGCRRLAPCRGSDNKEDSGSGAFPLTLVPAACRAQASTVPLSESIHLKEIMVQKVSTEWPFVWVNVQAFLKNQEHIQVFFKNRCLESGFFFTTSKQNKAQITIVATSGFHITKTDPACIEYLQMQINAQISKKQCSLSKKKKLILVSNSTVCLYEYRQQHQVRLHSWGCTTQPGSFSTVQGLNKGDCISIRVTAGCGGTYLFS